MNRPLRSGLNEFAEDARGPVVVTHGLADVALKTISTKTVCDQLPANLQTIIWSSSRSFTRQQNYKGKPGKSYTPVVHGLHTSHASYCYARQKFGSSISAGSFIVLISQSNAVGSRMNQCDVPDTFLTPCFFQCFFTRDYKLLSWSFPVFLNF